MNRGDSASPYSVRRSRRPQARLAASYTRTGRPRRHLPSNQAAGRRAKAKGHTARMYVHEESHSGILPMNQSNKDRKPSAENEEERPLIKENAGQPNTHPTQSGKRVSQGLAGVRKAARDDKEMKFTALLHHLTVDLLREAFTPSRGRPHPEWTVLLGASMKTGWKIDWLIFTTEFIAERTEHNRREESTYRKAMDGNAHWESRLWKIRSSSKPRSLSSTRFTRRTFSDFRMVFARGAASIKRWTRCRMCS